MARQKLKNHSGASKRFKRTGSGKWMRRRAKMRHILTTKPPRQKNRLTGPAIVRDVDSRALDRLLPYC
ncbi:MAG: 50S ribosomal protein L35 [Nitrospirales bacterium]